MCGQRPSGHTTERPAGDDGSVDGEERQGRGGAARRETTAPNAVARFCCRRMLAAVLLRAGLPMDVIDITPDANSLESNELFRVG